MPANLSAVFFVTFPSGKECFCLSKYATTRVVFDRYSMEAISILPFGMRCRGYCSNPEVMRSFKTSPILSKDSVVNRPVPWTNRCSWLASTPLSFAIRYFVNGHFSISPRSCSDASCGLRFAISHFLCMSICELLSLFQDTLSSMWLAVNYLFWCRNPTNVPHRRQVLRTHPGLPVAGLSSQSCGSMCCEHRTEVPRARVASRVP